MSGTLRICPATQRCVRIEQHIDRTVKYLCVLCRDVLFVWVCVSVICIVLPQERYIRNIQGLGGPVCMRWAVFVQFLSSLATLLLPPLPVHSTAHPLSFIIQSTDQWSRCSFTAKTTKNVFGHCLSRLHDKYGCLKSSGRWFQSRRPILREKLFRQSWRDG